MRYVEVAGVRPGTEEDRGMTEANERHGPLSPVVTAQGLLAGRLRR